MFDASNGTWLKDYPVPPGVTVVPESSQGSIGTKGILVFRDRPRPLTRELRHAVAMSIEREALGNGPDAEEFVPGDRLKPKPKAGLAFRDRVHGLGEPSLRGATRRDYARVWIEP